MYGVDRCRAAAVAGAAIGVRSVDRGTRKVNQARIRSCVRRGRTNGAPPDFRACPPAMCAPFIAETAKRV